jgi:beta-fructofuranosidase
MFHPILKPLKLALIIALAVVSSKECGAQRVGDVMPFYDASSSKFYIFYLRDIWSDATNQRHPWNALTTTNLNSYTEVGEKLSCSADPCKQDFAIGTGSVIKNGSTYYAFYTGHNPNAPGACSPIKEGVMLATSSNLNGSFTKSTTFTTIYPPAGFDCCDNFRDPYVFKNGSTFYMLISTRTTVNGTWKGVIAKYTSTNLTSWTYQGILYDGGAINYFMMECPSIFIMGSTYYLMFSDIGTNRVIYRKGTSVNGPWGYPVGSDILSNVGYAASTASNGTSRYIWGWQHTTGWAGNLIDKKLTQDANGDLVVSAAGSGTGGRVSSSETVPSQFEPGNRTVEGEVYPTLVEDNFTVDVSDYIITENDHASLQIVNMEGKVYEQKTISNQRSVSVSSKTLGMPSGLYLVKIRSAVRSGQVKVMVR